MAEGVKGFNPRTRARCDMNTGKIIGMEGGFQSTHPREVRLRDHNRQRRTRRFQSTHPREVRPPGAYPGDPGF